MDEFKRMAYLVKPSQKKEVEDFEEQFSLPILYKCKHETPQRSTPDIGQDQELEKPDF